MFVDLEKAFDRIRKKVIWWALSMARSAGKRDPSHNGNVQLCGDSSEDGEPKV